mmetsp:Transcript_17754/g.37451  ORF Transcript_17754/g.37451 Transcript_17754/m.37451 type:complete len:81 (-) Transcript_17754:581-823(-)
MWSNLSSNLLRLRNTLDNILFNGGNHRRHDNPFEQSFKHFMFFCMEFDIVSKEEMDPFEELLQPLRKEYQLSKSKRARSA